MCRPHLNDTTIKGVDYVCLCDVDNLGRPAVESNATETEGATRIGREYTLISIYLFRTWQDDKKENLSFRGINVHFYTQPNP